MIIHGGNVYCTLFNGYRFSMMLCDALRLMCSHQSLITELDIVESKRKWNNYNRSMWK